MRSRKLEVLCLTSSCLALLACAGPSDETPPSLVGGGALYRVAPRTVDAAYARGHAAMLGVTGELLETEDVFAVSDGGRAVIISKGTGGVRFFDRTAVAATQLSAAQAVAVADAYLRTLPITADLLRPGAGPTQAVALAPTAITSSSPDAATASFTAWQIGYDIVAPITAAADGAATPGRIDGATLTVTVGDGAVIGLAWDVPDLAAPATVPLFTTAEAYDTLPDEITRGPIGEAALVYQYRSFDRAAAAVLAPEYVFRTEGGVTYTPATPYTPRVELALGNDRLIEGEPIEANAIVSGGTPPFTITWRAWTADGGRVVLGTAAQLTTTLAPGTDRVELTVADANAMTVVRDAVVRRAPMRTALPELRSLDRGGDVGLPRGGTVVGTTAAWQLGYNMSVDRGLAVFNVDAGGQRVMTRMNTIFYDYMLQGHADRHACYLGDQPDSVAQCRSELIRTECWNGAVVTPNWPFLVPCFDPANEPLPWYASAGRIPTQPYHGRVWMDDSLVVRSTYRVTKLQAPAEQLPTDCHLLVTETYVMQPGVTGWQDCGSADGNDCYRFRPIIQYWVSNHTDDGWCDLAIDQGVKEVTFAQSYVPAVEASGYLETAGYVKDVKVYPPLLYTSIAQEETMKNMVFPGQPGASHADNDDESLMDNLHVRDASHPIYVPGCYRTLPQVPGSPGGPDAPLTNCLHMHWNWGGGNKIVDVNGTFTGPGLETLAQVPGSQSVLTMVATEKRSELGGLSTLFPPGTSSAAVTGHVLGWINPPASLNFSLHGDIGAQLRVIVLSRSQEGAGQNGLGNAGGITQALYDQFNMNDYFFE